jgi:DNA-directed RNA polymerase subunit alpha
MEPITESEIDLFAEQLPSMEDIDQLSKSVHSSAINISHFTQQIEENSSKRSPQANLAVGIGFFLVSRNDEAIAKLEKANDCKEKFIYLAYALRRGGRFDEAIENLQKSLKQGCDNLFVNLEKAATYRMACDLEKAAKELKGCKNFENVSAEYHYQLGRIDEIQGSYKQAIKNYQTAVELAPNHQNALFHLAYRCDLSGDESAAIDYYRQIAANSPMHINALLNLAVLYEDDGKYESALQSVDMVLAAHPNHQRAILFRKDITSSTTMFYDEEKEKRKDLKNQILETPISDFELSVRSRNCLRKMSISTIGDLLNITEAELLSYKNFGETSLKEIKIILDSKGLYLGMAAEDTQALLEETAEINEMDEQEPGFLNKPIDDLQLSVRAKKCLQKLNLQTLGEVIQKTEAELLGCKNFGVTSLNEIKKAIENLGLSLRSLE